MAMTAAWAAEPVTDDRPAPLYGEYATPAEVAAARGPLPDSDVALDPAPAPVRQPTSAVARPSTAPVSRWDRPITIALLAAGVVNVASSVPLYLDFAYSLRTF